VRLAALLHLNMINWLVQTTTDYPGAAAGLPLEGFLSLAEAAVFNGFKIQKRRSDWLLGRWTAKQLIGQVHEYDNGQALPFDQLSILPLKDGAPAAYQSIIGSEHPLDVSISISHSHDTAACAIIERPDWPLGIDLEWIAPRSAGFIADYFTPGEQALLRECPIENLPTHTTAVWSAKEAALKAIHQGLKVDTRCVSCLIQVENNPPRSWIPFTIQWDQQRFNRSVPSLEGWWRATETYVLTLVAQNYENNLNTNLSN